MSRNRTVKHINLKTENGLIAHKVLTQWADVSVDELTGFYLISNKRITPVRGVDDSTLAHIDSGKDALDPYQALLFLFAIEMDIPPKDVDISRVIINKSFDKELKDFTDEWYLDNTLYKPEVAAAMSHLAYSPRVASDSSTLDDNTVYYVEDLADS